MKTVSGLLFYLLILGCNKKAIQEDVVITAMTTGEWKMANFFDGTNDQNVGFTPYVFRFHKNNTVDAVNNFTIENTGTWGANADERTINAYFANALTPLALLNGTWKITNNSWTFVEASKTANGVVMNLRLEKM